MFRAEVVNKLAKKVTALLEENGLTYYETDVFFFAVKENLHVVGPNSGVVYRDGKAYERKPYAKEYTPVNP